MTEETKVRFLDPSVPDYTPVYMDEIMAYLQVKSKGAVIKAIEMHRIPEAADMGGSGGRKVWFAGQLRQWILAVATAAHESQWRAYKTSTDFRTMFGRSVP